MTICPCCGFKSANSESGVLGAAGCASCGARSVGEPLPRPEHELPSYARSLVLTVAGALMVLIFLTQTIIALVQRSSKAASPFALASIIPLDFWTWVAAAETAAWRLKFVMIPLSLVVLLISSKLYRSMQATPDRFCGLRYARHGYLASIMVPLLVLILIGVTVPERLRQRQRGIEAGFNAQGYRIDRALLEYREAFGTLPGELKDLSRLPDNDGSLAAALKNVDTSGYAVNSEVAAVPKKKPQPLRGAVILNASVPAVDETLGGGISFTNYELRLPGADKILSTDDDLIVRDGVITRVSETPRRGAGGNSAAQPRRP